MFFPMLTKTRLLTALLACGALSTTPFAQTIPPKTVGSDVQAAPFRSAFEGYRAYTDDSVANWKTANETVKGIGGWREYAKQAQSNDNAPPPAAAITTKPAAKAVP